MANAVLPVAIEILTAVESAADAFGPLKSAAGGALYFAKLADDFTSNKKEWLAFSEHILVNLACVTSLIKEASVPREDLKYAITQLQSKMERILSNVSTTRAKQKGFTGILAFVRDPKRIESLKAEFDDAIKLFNLKISVTALFDVAKVLQSVNTIGIVPDLLAKLSDDIVSKIKLSNAVQSLPYADGAAWNSARLCMPNTRVELLEEITLWIDPARTTNHAELFWIEGVAGSGKTSIANTVCQFARGSGQLVSSFFFNRLSSDLSSPSKLFSTIARDLASRYQQVATAMGEVLEQDVGLRSANPKRQFEDLILAPSISVCYPKDTVLLVVIDALDEGLENAYRGELLHILATTITQLPRGFRFLVTSRPDLKIVSALGQRPHVIRRPIDLHGTANNDDMALYVGVRMHEISTEARVKREWTEAEISETVAEKSEGLFQWASTVLDFLSNCRDPYKQLQDILNGRSPKSVESHMALLYTRILNACRWDDGDDFDDGYKRFMGTVIAAKEPLSCSAIQALHGNDTESPRLTFEELGSLLTGYTLDVEPVRIIHLSLRDFITAPPKDGTGSRRYHLSQEEHSDTLALLCLEMLDRELVSSNLGTGYLNTDVKTIEIPSLRKDDVLEAQYYACRFWTEHLADVKAPSAALISALRNVLMKHLLPWIELATALGHFPSLSALVEWLQVCEIVAGGLASYPSKNAGREAAHLMSELQQPHLGTCLHRLCLELHRRRRFEEALSAINEAVRICRHIAESRPETNALELASCLGYQTACLTDLGHHEQALTAIQEVTSLRRQLAAARPADFNPILASSLNDFSVVLSRLGRLPDALRAIEEAVELLDQLAKERPETFNPFLAVSLNNLSVRLSDLGRQEEALAAVQRAVALYRPLAEKKPAAFLPNLAMSLNNLSLRLADFSPNRNDAFSVIQEAVKIFSDLAKENPTAFNPQLAACLDSLFFLRLGPGTREEVLSAIQEAVTLRRQLAQERPEIFRSGLALSLINLSLSLAYVGRREDGLATIQDAVKLNRALTAERPSVFSGDLGWSLYCLSKQLADLDQHQAASDAAQEAVDRFRQAVFYLPTRVVRYSIRDARPYTVYLAWALDQLSRCKSVLERSEEAQSAQREASALRNAEVQREDSSSYEEALILQMKERYLV